MEKWAKHIEKIAIDRNHEVVLKITRNNLHELTTENLQLADAVIEFSTPSSVLQHIEQCFKAGIPVVVGTTGWYKEIEPIKLQCEQSGNALLYASNFSVGVNVFFYVNKVLAKLMNNYPYYDVQVEEIHHTQKVDAPSGTAITIGEGILENLDHKKEWVNVLTANDEKPPGGPVTSEQLLIESFRIDSVPGTHTVIYDSDVDSIEFKHTAFNRNGFALGAVMAAEWLKGKQGFYSVHDMFNF